MFTKNKITLMTALIAVVFILFAASCNNKKSDKNNTAKMLSAQTARKYIRYNAYKTEAVKFLADMDKAYVHA